MRNTRDAEISSLALTIDIEVQKALTTCLRTKFYQEALVLFRKHRLTATLHDDAKCNPFKHNHHHSTQFLSSGIQPLCKLTQQPKTAVARGLTPTMN